MGLCSDQNKCIMIVLASLVFYSAAIIMVVIGTLNLEKYVSLYQVMEGCRSAPGMPLFNITGGSIIMIGLFVREILKRFCECCNSCFDEDKCCRIGGKILKCGLTLIYDLGFMLIIAVWLVAGTASVIPAYEKILPDQITKAFENIKDTSDKIVTAINLPIVTESLNQQSQEQNSLNGLIQCDVVLYNLTLVVLIAGWIILALGALYVLIFKICYNLFSCKPCKDDQQQHQVYGA